MKQRIIILSSNEQLNTAKAVNRYLNKTNYCTIWDEDVFAPNQYPLPSLIEHFSKADFGIFIFSPDDILSIRNKTTQTVRDNVIFEFGMFIGMHGQDKAFIIAPSAIFRDNVRLPSDFVGIGILTYDEERSDLISSIRSSCDEIIERIEVITKKREKLIFKSLRKTETSNGLFKNEGEEYIELVDLFYKAKKEILIVSNNQINWCVRLITSIILACIRGIQITVLYYPELDDYEKAYRIDIIEKLGGTIIRKPKGIKAPMLGFIFDPQIDTTAKMIVRTHRQQLDGVFSKVYIGSESMPLINIIAEKLFHKTEKKINTYRPYVTRIPEKALFEIMKKVPTYKNASFELKITDIQNTKPQSNNIIREFKYNQIQLLRRFYLENGFKPYEPIGVILKDGDISPLIPPVIEKHGNDLLIAEGHTRIFDAIQTGENNLISIIVKGVKEVLPSVPGSWNMIEKSNDSVGGYIPSESKQQYVRKIESFTHW